MTKVTCPNHKDKNLSPVMIHFRKGSLGREYVCAVCSGVRVFNTGQIIKLKGPYGFIGGEKNNAFFHLSNCTHDFKPYLGMLVNFEISFIDDGRTQAINVKPLRGEKNGY